LMLVTGLPVCGSSGRYAAVLSAAVADGSALKLAMPNDGSDEC
jgi:hypothetical protein